MRGAVSQGRFACGRNRKCESIASEKPSTGGRKRTASNARRGEKRNCEKKSLHWGGGLKRRVKRRGGKMGKAHYKKRAGQLP